jgi:multidrug efflux system membrane fusion protein
MDLKRFKTLVAQGIISAQAVDTQNAAVNQYSAAMQSDQGAVESAKLNLVYSRITAPLAGRVGLRQVDPGNVVRASDAAGLCVITPLQPITVVFTVPSDNIQQILKRNKTGAKMVVEAYDRDLSDKLATGALFAIDNQVDTTTGTVKLKAMFTNQDGLLFPNQFVNARLLVDTLKNALIIPTSAIQRSPQGTFVYVVKADSTVELRNLEVMATDGDSTSIKSGLTEGETVVTDGLDKLRPGSKVSLPGSTSQGGGQGRNPDKKKGKS